MTSIFDDPKTTATPTKKRPKSKPLPIGSLFENYHLEDKGGYITHEFQDFGYRLAVALADLEHKSLYIKMAKTYPRKLLEAALSFVTDSKARSKGKLFMWKVKELQKSAKPVPQTGQSTS